MQVSAAEIEIAGQRPLTQEGRSDSRPDESHTMVAGENKALISPSVIKTGKDKIKPVLDSLKPMKLVETADGLMLHAEALYEQHENKMDPHDHDFTTSQLSLASDLRYGLEEKSLLAKRKQAIQYLRRAEDALETIKRIVDETTKL